MREYITTKEYALLYNIPESSVLYAIFENAVDYMIIRGSKGRRLYLVPKVAMLPKQYVPNMDRFREDEVPW